VNLVSPEVFRRLAAEALGTAFLLAGVVGSGIMAETLTEDIALALLANTIATGAILVVLITTLGPVSGAHFNPAVTLAMSTNQKCPVKGAGQSNSGPGYTFEAPVAP